jgi:hypothetical protein
MKRIIFIAPVALAAVASGAGDARALTEYHAAGHCQPMLSADVTASGADQFGVHSHSSTASTSYFCSGSTNAMPSTKVSISAYDRNSNVLGVTNVACTAYGLNSAGVAVWTSPLLQTAGSSLAIQTVTTASSFSNTGVKTVGLQCQVPNIDGASGNRSHLVSFRLVDP